MLTSLAASSNQTLTFNTSVPVGTSAAPVTAYAAIIGSGFTETDFNDNGASLTLTPLAAIVPTTSMALTAGASSACANTPLAFTANVINGGATPGYQWTNNGVDIPGANAATYTPIARKLWPTKKPPIQ